MPCNISQRHRHLKPHILIPAVLSALCSILLSGCGVFSPDNVKYESTGFYFDTVISVTVYGRSFEKLPEKCMELAAHYESLLSATLEGSDIWNINHSGGEPVTVDEDTLSLIETSLSYARFSDGLVDPTIGPLTSLWDFGSDGRGTIPEKEQIETALKHVDYRSILINGRQVTLADPKAHIDLGFIAKGFIADKMKEYLSSQGVSSALVNLGGNVVTLGTKPDGSPFRIGIQNPFEKNGSAALTLEITDKSVVSSGDYERFFEKDGKIYHHILSTDTGYPAESGLSQVTVLSPRSVDGDALSTLCFVLGYEKAALMLSDCPDIQAVFITKSGDIHYVNF